LSTSSNNYKDFRYFGANKSETEARKRNREEMSFEFVGRRGQY